MSLRDQNAETFVVGTAALVVKREKTRRRDKAVSSVARKSSRRHLCQVACNFCAQLSVESEDHSLPFFTTVLSLSLSKAIVLSHSVSAENDDGASSEDKELSSEATTTEDVLSAFAEYDENFSA